MKVITDWERSRSGSGMARNLFQGRSDDDDNSTGNSENSNLNERCMNFGMVMTESHFCEKGLPIYYTYGTWPTNMTL